MQDQLTANGVFAEPFSVRLVPMLDPMESHDGQDGDGVEQVQNGEAATPQPMSEGSAATRTGDSLVSVRPADRRPRVGGDDPLRRLFTSIDRSLILGIAESTMNVPTCD